MGVGRPHGSGGLVDALDRAFRELPVGDAESRLRQYCGRLWDILRTAEFRESYRASLETRRTFEADIPTLLTSCFGSIQSLITEGVERGEFRAVSAKATARLMVSSLFARAFWCGEGVESALSGSCSRAVPETLDLLWPALGIAGPVLRPPHPFRA